jgi:hypothetical protein
VNIFQENYQKPDLNYSLNYGFLFPWQFPQNNGQDNCCLEVKAEEGAYSFYLNRTILEKIAQLKLQGISLDIPKGLLLNLWYYSIFDSLVDRDENYDKSVDIYQHPQLSVLIYFFLVKTWKILTSQNRNKTIKFQSGFTFNSYYQSTENQHFDNLNIMMQSTILFDGDIIQKISQDLINNGDASGIVNSHYWLTEQVTKCLRSNLNSVYWFVSAIFPAAVITWKISSGMSLWLSILISTLGWIIIFLVLGTLSLLIISQLKKLLVRIRNKSVDKFIEPVISWLVWVVTNLVISVNVFSHDSVSLIENSLLMLFIPNVLKSLLPKVGKYLSKFFMK